MLIRGFCQTPHRCVSHNWPFWKAAKRLAPLPIHRGAPLITNVAPPPHWEHRRRFAQAITVIVAPYRSTSSATSSSKHSTAAPVADGGREPSYPGLPAQNRTCSFPASGSHLGY